MKPQLKRLHCRLTKLKLNERKTKDAFPFQRNAPLAMPPSMLSMKNQIDGFLIFLFICMHDFPSSCCFHGHGALVYSSTIKLFHQTCHIFSIVPQKWLSISGLPSNITLNEHSALFPLASVAVYTTNAVSLKM